MTYEIYVYGSGEILKSVFDAIAICINGKTGSLFIALRNLGLIVGIFWATIYALYRDLTTVFTNWIVPMSLMMNLLFIPQTCLWIHDPISKYSQKVDNVPYGLVAFSAYVNKIGHVITQEIEKVFSLPDDLKYHKSGYIFGCQLIEQAKSFRITNATLNENMREFVGHCVVYDVLLGNKYSLDELKTSDDVWGLVSTNASPVRMFLWKDLINQEQIRGKAKACLVTCQEGVKKFNQLWNQELERASDFYGKKIFGKNSLINPKTELLKYLPLAYQTMGSLAKSSSELLQQQMMLYALADGIEHKSSVLGNQINWNVRKAQLQQRSSYETIGAMAGQALITMKAVLEAIVYSAFILMIPLSILPNGWRILASWGQTVIWLQMWSPLYSVLNYVMTMVAHSKAMAIFSMYNDKGVCLASNVALSNMNADIGAMAGYLSLLVPFICIALVKGLGSFVHLAGQLTGTAQSVVGQTASQTLEGNYSFGNISTGNRQIMQSHMLSNSMAASYQAASTKIMDGRAEISSFGDGSNLINVASSNLPLGVNYADSLSDQYSQMSSQSYQKAINLAESSTQHLSSSYRDIIDLSSAISSSESLNNSTNQTLSSEKAKAIHQSAQIIESFAKDQNISTQKAVELFAQASVGGGVLLNGSLGGKISQSDFEQELLQKAHRYVKDHNLQEVMREAVNNSKSMSFNINDDTIRRLSESVAGSFEKGVNQSRQMVQSLNESTNYSNQSLATKSNSTTINANYNQQFVEWLKDQPTDNAKGSLGIRGAMHVISNQPEKAQVYAKRFMQEKGLTSEIATTNLKKYQDQNDNMKSSMNIKMNKNMNMPDFKKPDDNFIKAVKAKGSDLLKNDQKLYDQKTNLKTQSLNALDQTKSLIKNQQKLMEKQDQDLKNKFD